MGVDKLKKHLAAAKVGDVSLERIPLTNRPLGSRKKRVLLVDASNFFYHLMDAERVPKDKASDADPQAAPVGTDARTKSGGSEIDTCEVGDAGGANVVSFAVESFSACKSKDNALGEEEVVLVGPKVGGVAKNYNVENLSGFDDFVDYDAVDADEVDILGDKTASNTSSAVTPSTNGKVEVAIGCAIKEEEKLIDRRFCGTYEEFHKIFRQNIERARDDYGFDEIEFFLDGIDRNPFTAAKKRNKKKANKMIFMKLKKILDESDKIFEQAGLPVPILTTYQMRMILKDGNYTCNADNGDADTKILKRAKELAATKGEGSGGNDGPYEIFVWSHDTDFSIMAETPRCEFLDMSYMTDKVGEDGEIIPTLAAIVHRKSKIAEFLGISSNSLVEFCLFLGNDFCRHLDRKTFTINGEPLISPLDTADGDLLDFIVFEKIKKHPDAIIKSSDELSNLHLEYSRLFYSHGANHDDEYERLAKRYKELSSSAFSLSEKDSVGNTGIYEDDEADDEDEFEGLTQISNQWTEKIKLYCRNSGRLDRLKERKGDKKVETSADDFFFTLNYLETLRGGPEEGSSLLIYKKGLPKIKAVIEERDILLNAFDPSNLISSASSAGGGSSSTSTTEANTSELLAVVEATLTTSTKLIEDVAMLALTDNHFIAFRRMQEYLFAKYKAEQFPDSFDPAVDVEIKPAERVHEIDWNEYQVMHLYQQLQKHFHSLKIDKYLILDIEPRYLFDGLVFMHELDKIRRNAESNVINHNLDFKLSDAFGDDRVYPVDRYATLIENKISRNRITLISGATGCGKSTGVPRILINRLFKAGTQEGQCRILVIEPRRLVVENLYNRFVETLGGDKVGKRRGLEKPVNFNAPIVFTTAGYVLKRYLKNFQQLLDEKFTHIIIDEVHERSVEYDILLLLLKNMLGDEACKVKLVLMSATPNFRLYEHFFFDILKEQRRSKSDFASSSGHSRYTDGVLRRSIWIKNIAKGVTEEVLRKEINKCLESSNGRIGNSRSSKNPSFISNLMFESSNAMVEFNSADCTKAFIAASLDTSCSLLIEKAEPDQPLLDSTRPWDGPDPDFHVHIDMENGKKESGAPYEIIYIDSDEFAVLTKELGDEFSVNVDKIIHDCKKHVNFTPDGDDDEKDSDDEEDDGDCDSDAHIEAHEGKESLGPLAMIKSTVAVAKKVEEVNNIYKRPPIKSYFQQRQFEVLHLLVKTRLMEAKAVLVFVPGIGEAQKVANKFGRDRNIAVDIVHSSTERESEGFDFETAISQDSPLEDDVCGFLPAKFDPFNSSLYIKNIPKCIDGDEIAAAVRAKLSQAPLVSPEGSLPFKFTATSASMQGCFILTFKDRKEAVQASKYLYKENKSLLSFFDNDKNELVVAEVMWYVDKKLLRIPDDPNNRALFVSNFNGGYLELRNAINELGVICTFYVQQRGAGNYLVTFDNRLEAVQSANKLYFDGECKLVNPTENPTQISWSRSNTPPKLRLIIATNVLESGVTIGNVNAVICLGTNNVKAYDKNCRAVRSRLETSWINQASAQQRAGRTGRVAPGVVYRLYTRNMYEKVFKQDIEPDWMHLPISDLIIRVSHFLESAADETRLDRINESGLTSNSASGGGDGSRSSGGGGGNGLNRGRQVFGNIFELFSNIPQPFKDRSKIEESIKKLSDLNVIKINPHSQSYELTTSGKLINMMQVSVDIGLMIYLGVLLGIPSEIAVIATALESSDKSYLFRDPRSKSKYCHPDYINSQIRQQFFAQASLDGGVHSDPIMMLKLFKMYNTLKLSGNSDGTKLSDKQKDFTNQYYLNSKKLDEFYVLARNKVLELTTAICDINSNLGSDDLRPKSDGVFFFVCQQLDETDPVVHLIRSAIAWSNGGNILMTADVAIPLDRSISIGNHPALTENKLYELFPKVGCNPRIKTTNLESLTVDFKEKVNIDAFTQDLLKTLLHDPYDLEAILIWQNIEHRTESSSSGSDSNNFHQEVFLYVNYKKWPNSNEQLRKLQAVHDPESAIEVLSTSSDIRFLRLKTTTLRSHIDISAIRNNFSSLLEFFIPRFDFDKYVWNIRISNFPREYVKYFIQSKMSLLGHAIDDINSFNLNGHLAPVAADRVLGKDGKLIYQALDSNKAVANSNYQIFFDDEQVANFASGGSDGAAACGGGGGGGRGGSPDPNPNPLGNGSRRVLKDLELGRRLANTYAAVSINKSIRIGSFELFEPNESFDDFALTKAYYCNEYFGSGIDLGVRRDNNKWKIYESTNSELDRAFLDPFSVLASSRLYFDNHSPVYAAAGTVTFKHAENLDGESMVNYTCKGITVLPYSKKWLDENLTLPTFVTMDNPLAPNSECIRRTMERIREEVSNLSIPDWSSSHYAYLDNVQKEWDLEVMFPSAIRPISKNAYFHGEKRKNMQALLLFKSVAAKDRDIDAFRKNYLKPPCRDFFAEPSRCNRRNCGNSHIVSPNSNLKNNKCLILDNLRYIELCQRKYSPLLCRCSYKKNYFESQILKITKFCNRAFYVSPDGVYDNDMIREQFGKDQGLPSTCSECSHTNSFRLQIAFDGRVVLPAKDKILRILSDKMIKARDVVVEEQVEKGGATFLLITILFATDYKTENIQKFSKSLNALQGPNARRCIKLTFSSAGRGGNNQSHFDWRIVHEYLRSLSCKAVLTFVKFSTCEVRILCEDAASEEIACGLDMSCFYETVEEFSREVSVEVSNIDLSEFRKDDGGMFDCEVILKQCLISNGFRNISFVKLNEGNTAQIVFDNMESKQKCEASLRRANLAELTKRYIRKFSVKVNKLIPCCDQSFLTKFFISNHCDVAFVHTSADASMAVVFFENEASKLIASSMTQFLGDFTQHFSISIPAASFNDQLLGDFCCDECTVFNLQKAHNGNSVVVFFSDNESKMRAWRIVSSPHHPPTTTL